MKRAATSAPSGASFGIKRHPLVENSIVDILFDLLS
jgi:hypothetical protein